MVTVQLLELLLFIATWTVFIIERGEIFDENRTSIEECHVYLDLSCFSVLVQTLMTFRIGMTCYMNVKQSRPI